MMTWRVTYVISWMQCQVLRQWRDNKHTQSYFSFLGELYEQGWAGEVDILKAVEWYTKAADRGNTTAQYNLGCM